MLDRKSKEKILVTSALPYVNNVPHMGNIIGCVLSADVFARFKRSQENEVLYVCGTDEHGTTTETKAIEEGLTPKQICDKYYAVHKDVYEWFNISFDIFGRTSEENHHEITQNIFKDLKANEYITEKEVEQLYDEKEQKFLADRFVTGTCPFCKYEQARGDQCEHCGKLLDPSQLIKPKSGLSGQPPVKKKSTHLYLDLAKLQPKIETWFAKQSVEGKWTPNALTTTRAWLDKGLEPRAITRDLSWGVPVPGYKGKVFYVWFDATIGYISITGQMKGVDWKEWWQNPKVKLYQFMAKDNIPFHTIIFPASLIGTGKRWTLLHHINVTEYLQHEDGKFSKSRGTGLFGDDAMQTGIPADVYRYYLLINRPEKSDTTFAWKDLQDKSNNELLANLGNLVNRTLQFIKKYHESTVTEAVLDEVSANFFQWVVAEEQHVTHELDWAREKDALRRIMTISSKANQYFQEQAPWKAPNDDAAKRTMFLLSNVIKDLAIMIEPFIPATSLQIFKQLNLAPLKWKNLAELGVKDHKIGVPEPLFEKLDDDRITEIKEKLKKPHTDEPLKPLQIRAGTIVDVDRHPKADKLFIEKVDFGGEIQTIVSGLVDHYSQEELRGKTALFITNLETATLRGEKSEGMILVAEGEDGKGKEQMEVLFVDAPAGTFALGSGDEEQISINDFARHTLEVTAGSVLVDGEPLQVHNSPVAPKIVTDGKVR